MTISPKVACPVARSETLTPKRWSPYSRFRELAVLCDPQTRGACWLLYRQALSRGAKLLTSGAPSTVVGSLIPNENGESAIHCRPDDRSRQLRIPAADDTPLIDTRSPVEFAKGSLPTLSIYP